MKLAIFVLCGTLLFALSMQLEAQDLCKLCATEVDAFLKDIGSDTSKQNIIHHVHKRCATVMGGKIKDECIKAFESKKELIISKLQKGVSAIEGCEEFHICPKSWNYNAADASKPAAASD